MRFALARTVELLDDVVASDATRPVRPWMWGPALLGLALAEVETAVGDRGYEAWLARFADHHLERGALPVSADTIAPALVTAELARRTGESRYARATDRALAAVRAEEPLGGPPGGGAANHLGTSGYSRFYPRSVWVDSLMMVGVLAAREGAARGDERLTATAAAMPGAFADLLQDPVTGLWAHSWWAPGRFGGAHGRRYPRVAWARGNAWVVAALPAILEVVGSGPPAGPGSPAGRPDPVADGASRPVELARAVDVLGSTSAAIRRRQRPDGTWPTLLEPSGGYRELSATALVAGGWLRAVRLGLLEESYVVPARRALAAVVGAVDRRHGRWSLPEVSGPTIPLPVLPRAGYLAVRPGRDHPWGLAALALAAIEDDRLA
ncbi:glycoside hydrolase family 88 protein [Georgenia sp. Z1491]|uniref:glycoside hydrolase family 88 protein n=1 Tax=Georgenia sp. Z1491 TaxID=3416707 RepID=UPI003CE7C3C1